MGEKAREPGIRRSMLGISGAIFGGTAWIVDRRLVKTLLDLVLVILMHRHRNQGLILSELGDQLLGGERGPAGVKRIASLLHSMKWRSGLILKYLWRGANQKIQTLVAEGEEAYVIWDESVLEKSESLKAEGLCAVRSMKAARLKRIKPGYFNPPGGRPIFVPGFNWLQILVTGLKGTPVLAHLCWWSTRGEKASGRREEESKIRIISKIRGKRIGMRWYEFTSSFLNYFGKRRDGVFLQNAVTHIFVETDV